MCVSVCVCVCVCVCETQALAYLDMDEGLLDKKAQARLRLARIRRGDMLHNTPDNTNTHTKTHTELTSGPSDTHTSTHAAPSDPRLPVASLQHTQTHTQTQALGESLGLGEGQTVFARQVSDLDKEADTSNGQSNGFGAGTTDDDGSTAQVRFGFTIFSFLRTCHRAEHEPVKQRK